MPALRTSSDRLGPSVHRALESRNMRSETRERHFSSPSSLLERGMASRMNLYFLCRFIASEQWTMLSQTAHVCLSAQVSASTARVSNPSFVTDSHHGPAASAIMPHCIVATPDAVKNYTTA